MSPTTPGASSSDTTPDAGIFSQSLVPLPTSNLPGLPTPHDTRVELQERLEEAVAKVRAERTVHSPEDTFALIRSVQGASELMIEYGKAFTAVAATGKKILEEELFEAVGEQDGIPLSGLTVPHRAGGDIRLGVRVKNEYFFDMDQVVAALAALVASEWEAALESGDTDATPTSAPQVFARAVAMRALELMGATKPKVTQVKRVAHDLSANGDDQLARIVLDAIGMNRKFEGISVDRKPAA